MNYAKFKLKLISSLRKPCKLAVNDANPISRISLSLYNLFKCCKSYK